MRFALNSSRSILKTSLRAGRSLRGKQPWIRQETPIRGPQPSRSMTQTASYLQLYVLRLLAGDSSSNRLRGLACDIRARQTQPGQRLRHEESTAERQRALDDPDRSSRSTSRVGGDGDAGVELKLSDWCDETSAKIRSYVSTEDR